MTPQGRATAQRTLRIAHSPDADDAFMFYALARDRIPTAGYAFEHVLADIETLNRAALEGLYEVTACSIHAYPYLSDRYALLNSGASMGEGYGPVLVARRPLDRESLAAATVGATARERVAVPGALTSAYLALKLWMPEIQPIVLPFDRILEAVRDGEVVAGVIIHEGQLTFADEGLHAVVDLGAWWRESTGLPLPLGGNAIRRDLGRETIEEVAGIVRESIRYGIEHAEEALEHARGYGRGLTAERAARFVGMYVNQRTLDYGPDGRRAVQRFLDLGAESGFIARRVRVDFVGAGAAA
ncbi:MAG: ABC transporter substrate-binding protein [Gemmatimonadetes bacterium]|nr:ABC transporter substrate-binding protein [Gemmatimonadota bacterium]